MNTNLKTGLRLAALALALAVGPLNAQDTRVHILRSRTYTPKDSTGLVHAPERLTEVRTTGIPRGVGDCAQHLRDPARNVDLLLITSFSSTSTQTSGDTIYTFRTTYGDYAPKTRKVYGLLDGELVRVDCSRDRPVGKVTKSTALPDSR